MLIWQIVEQHLGQLWVMRLAGNHALTAVQHAYVDA
jgi:hypothetical protein